jgi:tetratricopeptide (TPR) repeat protein
MQQPIRAFVGHSFTQEDSGLVDVILKYLSRIAEMNPNFSWVHAENPEPEMVDIKVLSLLADKNVFIGICTKKERVIEQTCLKKSFFRNFLIAPEKDFQWKTSDWIIQEIGLAVGRGLKVILLLEKDVKTPGALQGNLEYIPLDRSAPEKSFDRLLAMISSLSPKSNQPGEVVTLGRPAEEEKTIEPTTAPGKSEWLIPKSEWKFDNYKKGAMYSVLIDDEAELKNITAAFLASTGGQPELNREHYESYIEYLRIIYSRNGVLANLEKIAETAERPEPLNFLGMSYEHYEEFVRAAGVFDRAAALSSSPTQAVRMLGKAALAYEKAGLRLEATEAENRMRNIVLPDAKDVEHVLKAELKLAEARKEDELALAAMEYLLELNPADNETRFSVAYKYSNVDQQELALLHYLRIPTQERDARSWNNLGVCLDSFDMPIKSVDAYRESDTKGETLAISNLAIKFLNAGFSNEAKVLLERGLQIPDHHKNIDTNLGRLKDAAEKESDLESAALEKAKPISEFYRNFGRSIASPLLEPLSETWVAPNCALRISITDGVFVASGTYEVRNGLIAALSLNQTVEPTKFSLEYRGVLHGRSVLGTVKRKQIGEKAPFKPKSIPSDSVQTPKVLMWLSANSDELHVLEYTSGDTPKRYSLHLQLSTQLR